MWTSNKFEIYPKQFDFTSSEQEKPTYTAIKIGDYEFSNLVESIEFESQFSFQHIICDHCGFSGCASGNWLSIRKNDEYIFFIPNFIDMKDEDLGADFQPSHYFKVNGCLYLKKNEYENLRSYIHQFPKPDELQNFEKEEIIELYKWDVPQKMFGEFPEFQSINEKRIIATSELNDSEVVKIIMQKVEELENSKSFSLKDFENKENIITIYLDDHKTTEWNALYRENNEFFLLLEGKFKIKTT